jgi:hypothetical protein
MAGFGILSFVFSTAMLASESVSLLVSWMVG